MTGPGLRIDLLGGFRVAVDDVAVDEAAWRLRSARGLIKLLALNPEHSMHREQVIEALWPERDPATASNNLRQALFVARRALESCGEDGARRLTFAREALTLGGDGLTIDLEEFEAAAAEAERAPSVDRCRTALELYRGELLPEDRFEEWTGARRQALADRHLTLLVDIARLHEEAEEHPAALAALQQALVEEPFHERAHRAMMRIYALTGRRQRALAQFQLLRESLRREFEDEPDEQTRKLYQDILARRIGPAPALPPARAAGNLPLQLTSFVGRDRELAEVVGLARRNRLLTLTGPGGCGKTRLALEAASALQAEQPGGAWLVELAGLSDAALVPSAVAAVLRVESRSARPSEKAVAAHIAGSQMLILLDNCEHLISACARLAEGLLTSCPNLTILVTSREPLHIAGEVDWRVPSLAAADAASLFADRARAVSSRFELTAENAEAVGEICRRVDGIPLAIELAAARVSVLAPGQIAERLRDSLQVLAAGSRTALTRQQTLTATIDWSHDLLDDDERELFRRLGAFSGSFDLAAVEAVCDGQLDVLGRLVDKSLLVVEEQDGVARYWLLDTVRHYARERMAEAAEQQALQGRHRAHYLELAELLEPTSDAPQTRRRLAREVDELRWALRTGLRSDPDEALRLAASLWWFWHDRGDRTEGARWLTAALDAVPEPSPHRARALHGLSVLALRIGSYEWSLATAGEAVEFFRSRGDRRALSEELHHLGTVAWVFSDYDGAERWCAESRALAEQAGERAIVASVIHTMGVIAASRNDIPAGRGLIAESIERLRALRPDGEPLLLPVARGYGPVERGDGRRRGVFLEQTFVTARMARPPAAAAYALCDLAAVTRDAGEAAAAAALAEESLAEFRGIGDDLGAAQALCLLGNLLAAEGQHEAARELHEQSLVTREAAGDARGIGLSLIAMSVAAARAGDPDRATASIERALALFERTDDLPGRAACITQRSYLAVDAGRLEDALEHKEQALVLWGQFARTAGWVPTILLDAAELDTALGDPERALARISQARESLANIGDRAGVAYCEKLLRAGANAPITVD
jgi:predicted ATPase/DNA-binding SARP family transcriptional activator